MMHNHQRLLRFAVLASGQGSNAVALMQAFQSGFIPAELCLVLSNQAHAPVLPKAQAFGYVTRVISHQGCTRKEHETKVLRALQEQRIDHVLLAGYMRVLSPYFLKHFWGTVLNIHPALLPDFPGLHAAYRQYAAKRLVIGATVHQVDEGVDTGPIVLQGSILADPCESAEQQAHRLLIEVEHVIYPRAVRLFIDRFYQHA